MRARLVPVLLLCLWGCVSPLQKGEARVGEGDVQGALEIWKGIPETHAQHAAARARIAAVESDLAARAARRLEEARKLEGAGRLTEAILDYRLSLRLDPSNAAVLAHVQRLAREARRKAKALRANYVSELAAGDLENAWETLQSLRALNPYEPDYESEERALSAARLAEWKAREERLRAQRRGEADQLADAALEAFREERLEEALELWQRALLLDPNDERVQSYVSRAERQLEALRRLEEEQRDEVGPFINACETVGRVRMQQEYPVQV